MDFELLEKSIGYTFKDKNLLKKALTHTSYAYENKIESNEKLFVYTLKQAVKFVNDKTVENITEKYAEMNAVEKIEK